MPHLIYGKRDGIAVLTMNRPEKRNAISPQMPVQLAEAWTDFRDDADARRTVACGEARPEAFARLIESEGVGLRGQVSAGEGEEPNRFRLIG